MEIDQGTIDYKSELLRKSIHLLSLSIPIIYYFITRELALKVLIPITFFAVVIDFGRHFSPPLKKTFNLLFGFLLREHEIDSKKRNLSGASYVLIAALICIVLFPKVIFITAFSVLILSDIAAALVGRKFGKHKFLSKSLEGTIAFFVIASIVVVFTPKVNGSFLEYVIGIIAVAVGTISENISYGWADDNLTIPFSISLVMWILYHLIFPGMALVLSNVPI
jgi:dolichol kinase